MPIPNDYSHDDLYIRHFNHNHDYGMGGCTMNETVLSDDAAHMASITKMVLRSAMNARTYTEIFDAIEDLESINDDIGGSHDGHPFWDLALQSVITAAELLVASVNPRP